MANLQPLRNYIRQNLPHLRSSPCLLITSAPPPAASTAVAGTKNPSSISSDEKERKEQRERLKFQQQQTDPRIHNFVERNAQSLTLEFNLRSLPCTIGSAFPTSSGVDEAVSLAKRAGLKGGGASGSGDQGVVIGIGSGAAMDLAKAVADSLFGNNIAPSCDGDGNDHDGGGGSLVLAPCTLGGLWAASSNSPSLLLDTKEEMLLPHLASSSWDSAISAADSTGSLRRKGTVLTLDSSRQLAMPPLYSRFQPIKRSEYSSVPSMAHLAAAALAIVLDSAHSVDAAARAGTINEHNAELHQVVSKEMQTVASSCASVLQLAAQEAKTDSGSNNDAEVTSNHNLAQKHLLDAIPRLSPLVEQSSLLSRMPLITTGTTPQKLANALLPAYFPQCHIATYLASILPGLCEVLSIHSASPSSVEKASMVENVAYSIIHCDGDAGNGVSTESLSLSSWVSQTTTEAGIPSMASLAFGTPDLNALVGSFNSYETLIASFNGCRVPINGSGRNDHWIAEDVLQRSLDR